MSSTHSSEALVRKRSRLITTSTSESDGDEPYCPPDDRKRHKKLRNGQDKDGNQTEPTLTKYVIIHKVLCSLSSPAHIDHPESACFMDAPSLDAGDSKATPLKGKNKIVDLQSYLESFPQISFVIERTYDCMEFHGELEKAGKYRKIEIGNVEDQVAMQLRPYLFILDAGASPSEPIRETMSFSISGTLENALTFCLSEGWVDDDTLVAPYLQFHHARKHMEAAESRLTPQWKMEIRALYEYLDDKFKDEYVEADGLFSQGLFTQRHFLKLFGSGDVLVNTSKSEPIAMLAKKILWRQKSTICIECETWSFDGMFKKMTKTVRISVPSKFSTHKKIPITSLDISPLRFNTGSLRDALQKRGEIFWSCRKSGLISYVAPTKGFDIQVVSLKTSNLLDRIVTKAQSNPRCMIDMEAYNELHGNSDDDKEGADSQSHHDELHTALLEQENPPPGSFLSLLPPTIKAFRFHDKKWKTLAVKHIRPVSWNKAAFEMLVLKQDKKDIIEALVTNHLEVERMADAVEGKGNGLVILLHGGPGTGKTFTAEGVAEIAERPLYRLTCGDIGTQPETVEKSLEHIFYLGSIWKAVVLLDEAEVFLEERTQADLQRNALVSVFLRALEYYDGILILTTNRVGTFDEAFKSRIHLALHYPPLSNDDRWQIWSNFIGGLKDDNTPENQIEINHGELRRKVDALARHKLNGRQIRNSIRTAKQLAKFKHEVLSSAHIEKTIGVVKEFEKYVEDTHGHTDADWVESGRIRVDKTED